MVFTETRRGHDTALVRKYLTKLQDLRSANAMQGAYGDYDDNAAGYYADEYYGEYGVRYEDDEESPTIPIALAAKEAAKVLLREMAKQIVKMVLKQLTKQALKKHFAKFMTKLIVKETGRLKAKGSVEADAKRLAEEAVSERAQEVLQTHEREIEEAAIKAGDDFIDEKLAFKWAELIPLYGDYLFGRKVYDVVYGGEVEAVVEATIDKKIEEILKREMPKQKFGAP